MSEIKININIPLSELVTTVKQHLASIGKRAVDAQGKSIYSNITLSSAEDTKMLNDLFENAAQSVVANLAPVSSDYMVDSEYIYFNILLTRYNDEDRELGGMNITNAARDAIKTYLYSFALAEYLSMIHPAVGPQHPPMYAQTFYDKCTAIMQNIIRIFYVKRPPKFSTHSYKDMKSLPTDYYDVYMTARNRRTFYTKKGDQDTVYDCHFEVMNGYAITGDENPYILSKDSDEDITVIYKKEWK